MSQCTGCGRAVRWARTLAGKGMPLDMDPNEKGNVVLRDGRAVVLSATVTAADGETRYMPHWATCEKAKEFKR